MASNRLVYSTDHGRTCPRCRKPMKRCPCKASDAAANSDGIVRVGRSTKGRKGKGVTTVSGVPLAGAALKAFAKKLKARCGAGGALKDGVIEIQGEQRDTLVPLLEAEGWTVKRVGG